MIGAGALVLALALGGLALARLGVRGSELRRARARASTLGGEVQPAGAATLGAGPSWLSSLLVTLDLPVEPARAWPPLVALSGCAVLVLLVRAPMVVVGSFAVGLATRPVLIRWRARRVDGAGELLVVVEGLAAALRSGASLRQAVARAGEGDGGGAAAGLRRAAVQVSGGMAVDGALEAWTRSASSPAAVLVTDALSLAATAGAGQAAALDAVADTLRERAALGREVRALASQARASAAVLVGAPIAFSAAASVADRRVAAFLFASPGGWACLLGGAALDGVGAWWMGRLVGRVS